MKVDSLSKQANYNLMVQSRNEHVDALQPLTGSNGTCELTPLKNPVTTAIHTYKLSLWGDLHSTVTWGKSIFERKAK